MNEKSERRAVQRNTKKKNTISMPEFYDETMMIGRMEVEKKEAQFNEMLSKINSVQCGQAKLNF